MFLNPCKCFLQTAYTSLLSEDSETEPLWLAREGYQW